MRNAFLLLVLLSATQAGAQSSAIETLRKKFAGEPEVVNFAVNGFFLKAALWTAGDTRWSEACRHVSRMRVVSVPVRHFEHKDVSISGFKEFVLRSHYNYLVESQTPGQLITIYVRDQDQSKPVYLILVEEAQELTALEVVGKIDVQKVIKL